MKKRLNIHQNLLRIRTKSLKMLNAILIDDEPPALQALESDLNKHCPQVRIIKKCTSAQQGLIAINDNNPDLVFLDVDMPVMNGFGLLQKFERIKFNVVFCTSYRKFAIDAFRISAVVDYLTKPIDSSQLIEAVRRAESKTVRGINKQHLAVLIENLNQVSKIALRGSKGLDFIDIRNIIYCKSEGNYVTVFLQNHPKKKITYSTFTLKSIEERLPYNGFCRINQSLLVNIDYIVHFNRGESFILLANQLKLPVSKIGKSSLLSKIDNITGGTI